MGNAARASYEITIGESRYTLRPTFEAIMQFQDVSGLGAFEGIDQLKGSPNIRVVVAAIWAGIKGEDLVQGSNKCPNFDDLGTEIMDFGVSKVVYEAFAFLHRASTPNDQKKNTELYLKMVKEEALKKMREEDQKMIAISALEKQTKEPDGGNSLVS